jgi:NTE family protein
MSGKNRPWALVLSGGGAKGLAHIGVLKALSVMGVPEPSLVVGTSMGAIVGGLYVCGMGPDELRDFALERFDIANYLDSFVFKMNGPVGKVFQTGQIVGNLATKRGIDSGHRLQKLFEKLTSNKSFADTRIPFRCNAVDLVLGKEVVFSSGPLAQAIRASISFPVFFEPVIIGDACLVDGGLSNNMPVYIARNEGIKRVLAVDVYHFWKSPLSALKNTPQLLYRSLEVGLNMMEKRAGLPANLTICAADKNMSAFNFAKKKELINLGERAVREGEKEIRDFFWGGWSFSSFRRRYRRCGIGAE